MSNDMSLDMGEGFSGMPAKKLHEGQVSNRRGADSDEKKKVSSPASNRRGADWEEEKKVSSPESNRRGAESNGKKRCPAWHQIAEALKPKKRKGARPGIKSPRRRIQEKKECPGEEKQVKSPPRERVVH